MTVTVPVGLKKARGPMLGLPHLLQLRYHPISHNEFLRETYGELYRLKVFGVTMLMLIGIQSRSPASVSMSERGPIPATAIGGCGRW